MKVLNSIKGRIAGVFACAVLLSLVSCSGGNDDKTLSDPQIASVAVTANQIDVNYGKIALEKSKNPVIRNFAETMIKDHENIIKQATDLAGQLNLTPEDNATTQSLLDGEKTTTAKLDSLSGADFDKAYIENEVAYHKSVISAVKDVLIPAAKNEQLKDLLTQVTPLLDHHQEMAEDAEKSYANAPVLSDPEIASVAVAANQIDVDYGKLALKKSKNEDVRKFAQTMVNDHSDIIKQAAALAKKLGVVPQDNAMTQSLLAGQKDELAKLNGLTGADFDKAYIDNEVKYHAAVINAVKTILTPQIQNAEFKDLVVTITPNLDHHLEMAKEAQKKIDGQ